MKKAIYILFLLSWLNNYSQSESPQLKIHTFSELEQKYKMQQKPVIIFVYTDWCKVCFAMKNTTLKNKKLVSLLNNQFYFSMLNGESKKNITFLNKKYTYIATGDNTGIHELANELAAKNRIIAYPTTIFLNKRLEIETQIVGFSKSKKMIQMLKKMILLN